MNYTSSIFNILLITVSLVSGLCHAQYIPVAILLESQREEFTHKNVLDPILSELAIHIDQQYSPILVSAPLMERFIRYQQRFLIEKQTKTSDLSKLLAMIAERAKNKDSHSTVQLTHFYKIYLLKRRNSNEAVQDQTTEEHPLDAIGELLVQKPYLISHLFVSRASVKNWQAYQVKGSDGHNAPLYLLLPPTYKKAHKQLIAKENNSINLEYTQLTQLINNACSARSPRVGPEGYAPIKTNAIASVLKQLHHSITPSNKKKQFIISLGGHGRYSRSPFGIAFSFIRPKTYTSLPNSPLTQVTPDPYSSIAGLTIPEFKQFLTTCNQLPTALLYYDSCFTGNHHLIKPFKNRNGILKKLNFTVATRCMDGGVSGHERCRLIFFAQDPAQAQITNSINPKGFFKECAIWCKAKQKEEKLDILKHAFLNMVGNKNKNYTMVRYADATQFTPLVTSKNIAITPQSVAQLQDKVIKLKRTFTNVFLGHNKIDATIKGFMPIIRSIIPTNATHFIKKIESDCSAPISSLEHISRIFFHQYNHQAVNRMIFFVKTLQLTSASKKPDTLRNVFVLHHTPWAKQKNSFAIWPNSDNKEEEDYFMAIPNKNGRLDEKSKKSIPTSTATATVLYYLGLRETDLSYIDAPTLKQATPNAFDDTCVKNYCRNSFDTPNNTSQAIQDIWKKIDYIDK